MQQIRVQCGFCRLELGIHCKKDTEVLGRVQRRAMELGHTSDGERPRKLRVFGLEKRRLCSMLASFLLWPPKSGYHTLFP